ncbi:MAG: CPBP family intramembrane glutamic endopeptidase [Promethearchaeota archaeon]|jgi:membrane protease YdiL (CAAX protease family)
MAVQLGQNSWVLIGLMLLEFFFVIIPLFLSSKIEKKDFKTVLSEIGFEKSNDFTIKIIAGVSFGILLFFSGDFIIIFVRNLIIENLFGTEFILSGQEGVVSTIPVQPNITQLIIIIILQILVVGPCEEAFFRGFFIKKLKERTKSIYLVLISSTLFAFYHVPPFLVPLTTVVTFFGYFFIIGVSLSLIFYYFKYSLIPVSVAHSCFNILILLI